MTVYPSQASTLAATAPKVDALNFIAPASPKAKCVTKYLIKNIGLPLPGMQE